MIVWMTFFIILYIPNTDRNIMSCSATTIAPKNLQKYHGVCLAGHSLGSRLYKTLVQSCWLPHMYTDILNYANSCPQYAIVEATGRKTKTIASTYCFSIPSKQSEWIYYVANHLLLLEESDIQ